MKSLKNILYHNKICYLGKTLGYDALLIVWQLRITVDRLIKDDIMRPTWIVVVYKDEQ